MRSWGILLASALLLVGWDRPNRATFSHVYNTVLNGKAVYRFDGTWRFRTKGNPDSIRVTIPLPKGPVTDLCHFAWAPASVHVTFTGAAGETLASGVRTSQEHIHDGALCVFSVQHGRNAPPSFLMRVTFVETLFVYVHGSPAGPLPREQVDFSDSSDVDWRDESVAAFADTLSERGTLFSAYYGSSDHRQLMALDDWFLRADYAHGDSVPRRASHVLKTESGQCEGFANLAQAVLAQMHVRSRAVVTAPCSLQVFGRDSTSLRGHELHALVEYRTPCGWGIMEPKFSDDMTIPQIRFASGDDLKSLSMHCSPGVVQVGMDYTITDLVLTGLAPGRDYGLNSTDGGPVMKWPRRLNTQRELKDPCVVRCDPRTHFAQIY
jgi:Transglutaminase-like superfamily